MKQTSNSGCFFLLKKTCIKDEAARNKLLLLTTRLVEVSDDQQIFQWCRKPYDSFNSMSFRLPTLAMMFVYSVNRINRPDFYQVDRS